MFKNKFLYHISTYKKNKFETVSLLFFFLSLIFSKYHFNFIQDIKISLFDIVALVFLPYLLKNFKHLKFKSFFYFFLIFLGYIFINFLIEIITLEKNFDYLLFKKKILLLLQIFRSAAIFLIVYLISCKLKFKDLMLLCIDIFALYSLVILILFFINSYFFLDQTWHIFINDIHRALEKIRLSGFFDDPNFLSLFACYFIIFSIYFNLNFFYTFLFSLIIIFSGSKTGYIYLLVSIFMYLSLFKFTSEHKSGKFFKFLFYSIVIIYSFFIVLDLANYFFINEGLITPYEPKSRYYLFLDFFNQPRFKMWKDFISQDINFLFGNGIYELTNYSKMRYNNFSHNSFLDIYYDFGLFGLITFFIFYFKTFDLSKKKMIQKNYLFIFLSINFLMFVFFFNFTIFYLPFLWFMLAIIINFSSQKSTI